MKTRFGATPRAPALGPAAAALAAALLMSGCTTPHNGAPAQATSSASAASAAQAASAQFEHVMTLANTHRAKEADPAVQALIDSAGFQELSGGQQHYALLLGGTYAMQRHDKAQALALLKRASTMGEASAQDWVLRLRAAQAADDAEDAVLSLTKIAKRWPAELPAVESWLVRYAVNASEKEDRYTLLKALYDGEFPNELGEFDEWWRDLALLELAQGDRTGALATVRRITDPYVLVGVNADKRFDPLRAELGSRLDVAAAAERAIETARLATEKDPDELKPLLRLTDLLDSTQRHTEALQLADAAIARAGGPQGAKVFRDYRDEYLDLLDRRAGELFALGRMDEAVEQLQAASRMSEYGTRNINQVINLAVMYCELGRPADARATLSTLSANSTSPYGAMQVANVAMWAAIQLVDSTEMQRNLTYLSEHRKDALETYQFALVIAGHMDEAAQLLISRLADPTERSDALTYVQDYLEQHWPPPEQEVEERWRALTKRPDVRAAVQKVGRIDRYPLN